MIDKTKIYDLFGQMRNAASESTTLVIALKNGMLQHFPLSICECDWIERTFIETHRIADSTVCEIAEIFTIGKPACQFKKPSADEVKSALVRHFQCQNSIVFQLKDDDGRMSLYYYHRSDIGEPDLIKANHKTIYFSTGRCFYTPNLTGIIHVKEVLFNN